MSEKKRMQMAFSKVPQLLSINKKASLAVLPIAAIVLAAHASGLVQKAAVERDSSPIVLVDDAFDKVSEAYIEHLFATAEHDGKFVRDRFSHDDYSLKQKHCFELHASRKGLGMAFFRTNEGNYGKLLYTWGVGPKLHLQEVVVFDSQSGKTVVRTDKNISLDLAGHYDLDTGAGSHATWEDGYGDDHYRPDLRHSSVYGLDRHLEGTDGASFLFPIDNLAP